MDYINLQNLDKKAYKIALDLLRDTNKIKLDPRPYKTSRNEVLSEFKHTIIDQKDITFQVSGFIKQAEKYQKCAFFISIYDKKRNGEPVPMTQIQHKKLTELINSKLIH